ncbi:membrane-spanning 4-domains subfamily A member 4D-like [Cebidichthys violaceus]|uniref:membrane-spanning 4-domains subfamily A member 4D-like n=1 Tax=Cebidichthys violaceus TaxID=271503 RepID=UPI0035CB7E50
MSADLYCASDSGGNNANLQGTTVGGSKPLHRFIKGQPKIIGIIALVLGSSFFILSIAIMPDNSVQFISTTVPPGFLLGTLFIFCGILYILTEHNPTKKTVTISLALSIVTTLGACWTLMHILPNTVHHSYYRDYEYIEDNFTHGPDWSYEEMVTSVEVIFLVYSVVGAIIFIVMACLAVAALRSTKSQAIIVMTTTPDETAVE